MDDSLLKGSQIRSHRCTWEGSADHYTGRIIAAHQISSGMNIKTYCKADREGRSQWCENCLGCAARHLKDVLRGNKAKIQLWKMEQLCRVQSMRQVLSVLMSDLFSGYLFILSAVKITIALWSKTHISREINKWQFVKATVWNLMPPLFKVKKQHCLAAHNYIYSHNVHVYSSCGM